MCGLKTLVVMFAVCCLLAFVASDDVNLDDESYTEWKKTFCENRNRTFNEDMYACWLTEPKAVLEATEDCINRAAPSANGNLVDFIEVACHNKTIYLKFAACNTEYESNEEYRRQMEVSPETIACYDAVFAKYGLTTP